MTDPIDNLHDTGAERALLGAMMHRPSVVEEAGRVLVSSDFYTPAHAIIFDAALALNDRGHAAEPQAIGTYLGDLSPIGGPAALIELLSSAPRTTNTAVFVGKIKECANRRLVYRAATDAIARITNGGSAVDATDALAEDLGRVELNAGGRELTTESFESMVAAENEALPDWVIPGMLRRRNRMMITAPTKTGKATMIRQIAFATSRGIHPLTFNPIEPRRVLLVDLENPREQYTEEHNDRMVRRADYLNRGDLAGNLQVLHRDRGLNLRARSDRLLLEDLLRRQRPDLLCICPVYKSFQKAKGNEDAEAAVMEVCDIFDHLRTTYDCALILEHHSPRGSVELFPFGSSVWERWVEFGRTMRRTEGNPHYVEWGTFCAGDRLTVQWPVGFQWGVHGWPYDPVWGPEGPPRTEP